MYQILKSHPVAAQHQDPAQSANFEYFVFAAHLIRYLDTNAVAFLGAFHSFMFDLHGFNFFF